MQTNNTPMLRGSNRILKKANQDKTQIKRPSLFTYWCRAISMIENIGTYLAVCTSINEKNSGLIERNNLPV